MDLRLNSGKRGHFYVARSIVMYCFFSFCTFVSLYCIAIKNLGPQSLSWLVKAIKKFRHHRKSVVIYSVRNIIISIHFTMACFKLTECVKREKYARELMREHAQTREKIGRGLGTEKKRFLLSPFFIPLSQPVNTIYKLGAG